LAQVHRQGRMCDGARGGRIPPVASVSHGPFFSFLSFSPHRRAAATAMRVQHLGMLAAMLCGACSLTPGGAAVLPRLLTRTAWDNLAFFLLPYFSYQNHG